MTRFIAIMSGKGGVGKTTVAINLAQALHALGQHTVVVDGNIITPNVGLHLGVVNPVATLNQFLRREKTLPDVIHTHESGLSFIPASPSYKEFQKSSQGRTAEIFEHLDHAFDFAIIDAPSGYSEEALNLLRNCDETVIVVNPTLSSSVEALKTIELAKQHGKPVAGIALNMSNWGRHELKPAEVEELLGYPIIANVRVDRKVRKSQYRQTPLNFRYPYSRSARQFKVLAQHLSMDTR